jgi:hypothetical protein
MHPITHIPVQAFLRAMLASTSTWDAALLRHAMVDTVELVPTATMVLVAVVGTVVVAVPVAMVVAVRCSDFNETLLVRECHLDTYVCRYKVTCLRTNTIFALEPLFLTSTVIAICCYTFCINTEGGSFVNPKLGTSPTAKAINDGNHGYIKIEYVA